jgi:ferredoxin--NADP+ reductase
VAPDQDKIKSVVRAFARIAANQQFGFYGHVQIGRDLTIAELCGCYHAVILAVGAVTPRRLGIPGEELPGSHGSTEFVSWYNGHPEHATACFDLSCERAVVIGAGNVALDVARVLAKGAAGLRHTDIPAYAAAALAASRVREIVIVGRRGPLQSRFTLPELRNLSDLPGGEVVFPVDERELEAASQAELDGPEGGLLRRTWQALVQFPAVPDPAVARRIVLRFRRRPVRLEGEGRVERVILERTRLSGPPGQAQAVGTGEYETLPAGLVIGCVGYRGAPVPGVPFDEQTGLIPNRDGRVCQGEAPVPGLYVVGWIKHQQRGVIGDTKADSAATVKALLADLPTLPPPPHPEPDAVVTLLRQRGLAEVAFAEWERLDQAELARGQTAGKAREKFTHIPDMLAFLRQAAP